jgi:hypothetical protein
MPSGARLWWVQHGSPQGVAQETATCTWPCETSRRCSSSGGIIVDSGSTVSESQQEAETVFSQSLCTTSSSSSGNFNFGASSSGSSSGSFVPQIPATGGSSITGNSASWNQGTNGAAGTSNGNTGATFQVTGTSGGSPSNIDGKCINIHFPIYLLTEKNELCLFF